MILRPLIDWWWLGVAFAPLAGFVFWQIIKGQRTMRRLWLRRAGLVVLLLIIALRPMLPGGTTQAGRTSLDVFFVIDTTSSMVAQDFGGDKPRLDGVRADIKNIVTALAGAQYAVVTFDSTTHVELPLTSDATSVATEANLLEPEITFYSQGSSIDAPIKTLQTLLGNAKKSHPERKRLVFYMSDGEQTNGKTPVSFASLRSDVDGGSVLGYGTATGGRMLANDGFGDNQPQYIKDNSSHVYPVPDAISRIDENNLQAIASQLGTQYVHRTTPTTDASSLMNSGTIDRIQGENRDLSTYTDLYWIAAIPLVGLLGWELLGLIDKLSELRQLRRQL